MFCAKSEFSELLGVEPESELAFVGVFCCPAAAACVALTISVILASKFSVPFDKTDVISTKVNPSFWASSADISFRINSKIFPSASLNSIFKSSSTSSETYLTPAGILILIVLFNTKLSSVNDFLPFIATIFDKSISWPYFTIETIL